MNETKGRYATKRLIQLSKEQEERIAAQSVQKIQAFTSEAAQIQSRRCEVMIGLVMAQVQHGGIESLKLDALDAFQTAARSVVDMDGRQKWTELKALFVELGVHGPQPHLEWAAKQVGVVLFDEPAEESLIQPVTIEGVEKVIQ